jgi:hypothetical protein
MADRPDDPNLVRLTADLARSLRDLQRELEARRDPQLPTPGDLLRFTDEVAIPAAILLLETNVRALRLLQRAIRLADDRGGRPSDQGAVSDRAASLGRVTLERLDTALADVQGAIEGRPADDDARELLDEARDLRREIDDRLPERAEPPADATTDADADADEAVREVPVDVEAELRSIRDEVDDDDE